MLAQAVSSGLPLVVQTYLRSNLLDPPCLVQFVSFIEVQPGDKRCQGLCQVSCAAIAHLPSAWIVSSLKKPQDSASYNIRVSQWILKPITLSRKISIGVQFMDRGWATSLPQQTMSVKRAPFSQSPNSWDLRSCVPFKKHQHVFSPKP